MASEEERWDGLYLNVAQQARGIEPLLDSVFSFLRRKTDFYSGASLDKIEEMVIGTVRKQASLYERDESKKRQAAEAKDRKTKEQQAARAKKQKADGALEAGVDGGFDISAMDTAQEPPKPAVAPARKPPATETKEAEAAQPAGGEGEEVLKVDDDADDDKDVPLGGGGTTDKYTWTQTLQEVNMFVRLPPGTKSNQVTCDIGGKHLKLGIKGQELMIDGELHSKVKVEDSFWTLDDGEVNITLQKFADTEWWKNVVKGDAEIDTRKIRPENSKLDELDGETRQTVEKMMFDQRQKAMGLPTADELQKREMLEKFMKMHPEMDFSQAKIS